MQGLRRALVLGSLALAVPAHAASRMPGPLARASGLTSLSPWTAKDDATASDSGAMPATPAIAGDDLGPTSEVPWNPPRPVGNAEPWEMALRAPGRLVSFPLSALGWATQRGLVYVEESAIVPRVLYLIALQQRIGLFLTTSSLGDRTGLGGAMRLAPPRLGGHLMGELSASTAQYNRARVTAGAGPARLTYGYEWRSRDQFFGLGRSTREDSVSTYASRIQGLEASLGWTWSVSSGPRTEVRAWIGPRDVVQRDGRDPEKEGVLERFPKYAGVLDTHVEHLIYGARLSHDRRAGQPHWSHGWRLAAEAMRFDRSIESLAIRDAATPAVQFTRYKVEAEAGVSFMRDPRTLRLLLRVVDQDVPSGPGIFLFRDLARLGGSDGLAGYEPGRHHGFDLAVAKASYIFPLAKHFEFDLHVEAGDVYERLENLRLGTLEYSYGAALRPRLETAPLGSIGVDWSDEGVRVRYSVGGVE